MDTKNADERVRRWLLGQLEGHGAERLTTRDDAGDRLSDEDRPAIAEAVERMRAVLATPVAHPGDAVLLGRLQAAKSWAEETAPEGQEERHISLLQGYDHVAGLALDIEGLLLVLRGHLAVRREIGRVLGGSGSETALEAARRVAKEHQAMCAGLAECAAQMRAAEAEMAALDRAEEVATHALAGVEGRARAEGVAVGAARERATEAPPDGLVQVFP